MQSTSLKERERKSITEAEGKLRGHEGLFRGFSSLFFKKKEICCRRYRSSMIMPGNDIEKRKLACVSSTHVYAKKIFYEQQQLQ